MSVQMKSRKIDLWGHGARGCESAGHNPAAAPRPPVTRHVSPGAETAGGGAVVAVGVVQRDAVGGVEPRGEVAVGGLIAQALAVGVALGRVVAHLESGSRASVGLPNRAGRAWG